MKYRVLRSVSVAMKPGDETARAWQKGDIITDAPKAAITDWLKIGAIEAIGKEVTDGES